MVRQNDPVDRAADRIQTLRALFDGRALSEDDEDRALVALSQLPVDLIEAALRGRTPPPVAAVLHAALRRSQGEVAAEAKVTLRVAQVLDAALGALQDDKAREHLLGRKHTVEVLRLLSESENPLKRSDVARIYEARTQEKLDPSRFGQILEDLGDAGLVLRLERSTQGGRAIWYSISPIGREALASRGPTVEVGARPDPPATGHTIGSVAREALVNHLATVEARVRAESAPRCFPRNHAAIKRVVDTHRPSGAQA